MIELIILALIVFAAPLPWWLIAFHLVNKKRNHLLSTIAYLAVGIVWLVLGLWAYTHQDFFFSSTLKVNPIFLAFGLVCAALALIIDWEVIKHLGVRRLICVAELKGNSKNQLVTSGIYKYARHPRYIEYSLWSLAIGFIFGYIFMFWFALYIFLAFWLTTYAEEAELAARFGSAYRKYQREVPRFFVPFIYKT